MKIFAAATLSKVKLDPTWSPPSSSSSSSSSSFALLRRSSSSICVMMMRMAPSLSLLDMLFSLQNLCLLFGFCEFWWLWQRSKADSVFLHVCHQGTNSSDHLKQKQELQHVEDPTYGNGSGPTLTDDMLRLFFFVFKENCTMPLFYRWSQCLCLSLNENLAKQFLLLFFYGPMLCIFGHNTQVFPKMKFFSNIHCTPQYFWKF